MGQENWFTLVLCQNHYLLAVTWKVDNEPSKPVALGEETRKQNVNSMCDKIYDKRLQEREAFKK